MTNELIKLNERLLYLYSKKERIPDELFLEIAGVIDVIKNEKK